MERAITKSPFRVSAFSGSQRRWPLGRADGRLKARLLCSSSPDNTHNSERARTLITPSATGWRENICWTGPDKSKHWPDSNYKLFVPTPVSRPSAADLWTHATTNSYYALERLVFVFLDSRTSARELLLTKERFVSTLTRRQGSHRSNKEDVDGREELDSPRNSQFYRGFRLNNQSEVCLIIFRNIINSFF